MTENLASVENRSFQSRWVYNQPFDFLTSGILMKIGVYAQSLLDPKLTGIGYFTYNLLKHLLSIDRENRYFFFSSRKMAHPIEGESVCKESFLYFPYFTYPFLANPYKCNLHFFPTEIVPFQLESPTVVTVFDLFYLNPPEEVRSKMPIKPKIHYWLAKQLHFKRASRIIAISEDTKNALIDLCGVPSDKITVVYPGCDKKHFKAAGPEAIESVILKYGISKPYFINMSSLWWERKNLCRLIEAFAQFRKLGNDFQLVITGRKGSAFEDMSKIIRSCGLRDEIKLLEYVPLLDTPSLLSGAEALIFPSLHEGFGLPILEAMACGCPVITSNTSALAEVSGGACYLIDPYSVEAIVRAMDALGSVSTRESLIKKGLERATDFSWERSATTALQVFETADRCFL